MTLYYKAITGKSFEDDKIMRNWASYIKALEKAGADIKITRFLDHIREAYRNPISHPSETLEPEDAFNLFSAGLSAICQAMKPTIVNLKAVKPLQGINALAAPAPPAAPSTS